MPFENLVVGRVCLHEVHRLGNDGNVVAPTYGAGLLNLDPAAMEAFRTRIVAAFSSGAQCMTMAVRQHADGSVMAIGAALEGAPDGRFLTKSRLLADALAAAQTSRTIPGGLVVVFDGTVVVDVGRPARRFFAVMKAELHEGFLKTNDLQARFVDNLFLSPKTKLYKIGLFVSDGVAPPPALPEGWAVTLYDSTMSASRRDAAATYFYSAFLGLDVPVDAAHQVRVFFDKTKSFIAAADIDQEAKVDLFNGLYTYLKVDQGNTVQVSRFADRHMPPEMADEYKAHMRRERFPAGAIVKDLSEVSGSLRLRRLRFPRSITLQGPPDAMRDLVDVETAEGEGGDRWTLVTIRGTVEAQE